MTDRATGARPSALDGVKVLVTGGNGGIGLAMAEACGAAGAEVVVWGRDAAKNDEAVGERNDLSAKEPARVKAMQAAWDKWNAELQPPAWRAPDRARQRQQRRGAAAPGQ